MRRLAHIFKITWPILRREEKFECFARYQIPSLINSVHRRNFRSINNVELVRPGSLRPYHPIRSGDLEPMPDLNPDALKLEFNEVDEVKE